MFTDVTTSYDDGKLSMTDDGLRLVVSNDSLADQDLFEATRTSATGTFGSLDTSRFGGTILGYRVQKGGEFDGRMTFRFRASMEHKGVKTDRKGWGNEKKVLGCDGETTRKRAAAHAQVICEAPKDS